MDRLPIDKSIAQEDKFLNALADAYRLQEAIISATELAIISTNTRGIITSFNHAAEELLGYDADDVIGKVSPVVFHDLDEIISRSQLISQEVRETIDPGLEVLIYKPRKSRIADRQDWNYVRKDGIRFPVTVSITSLWDERDKLLGYAFIATDITEQKKASDRIKDSESHLQALVSSVEDVIYEVGIDNRCTAIFSKHDNSLIQQGENFTGRPITDLFDSQYSETIEELLNQVRHSGQAQMMEYQMNNRWFSARFAKIVSVSDSTHQRISISCHDITVRKHVEFDLKDSEQKFRLLADNVPGVIYLCNNDADYSMLYLNDNVLEMTGYSKEDFYSGTVHFPVIMNPDDLIRVNAAVDNAIAERTSFHVIYRITHRSGEIRWLEEYGIGVHEDNRLLFIEGFISDITRRKIAEQELIQSKNNLESLMIKLQEQNRQLDEFAHIISHNIRGPVGNITALISFLNDQSSLHDYKQIFEKIQAVSQNLNETMNEIMDTLKIKKNAKIERAQLRFKDVLDKVVQSFEGNLIQCGASITYDFKAPTVFYPKTYLESIFQNLLSNAIKYRSENRPLTIHFSTESSTNGNAILRVSDNGLGIDMTRNADKLFGLHKTFHNNKESRGVGLFLTKTQIETMGGTIKAESEVDKGTTFIISF